MAVACAAQRLPGPWCAVGRHHLVAIVGEGVVVEVAVEHGVDHPPFAVHEPHSVAPGAVAQAEVGHEIGLGDVAAAQHPPRPGLDVGPVGDHDGGRVEVPSAGMDGPTTQGDRFGAGVVQLYPLEA